MNVRRPEWEEQPVRPMFRNARLNQITTFRLERCNANKVGRALGFRLI